MQAAWIINKILTNTRPWTAIYRPFLVGDDSQLTAKAMVIPDSKKIPWWAPWRYCTKKNKEKENSGGSGDDGTFVVPGNWLKTDIHDGLQEGDIESRRKKSGWNELTAEKENMFRKFLSYFQGPILYGWY